MGLLELLTPIYRSIPEIRAPAAKPSLKKRLFWSLAVLLLFFIMGRTRLIGLSAIAAERLAGLQVILASELGSLTTAGISPIVLSSIILQLLIGGGIVKLNLTSMEDRARFQGLQKLLAILMSLFEGFIYTMSGLITAEPGMMVFVALQIAVGSILIIYLDEIVSKYGIGSGVGLFIAGGVGAGFFWMVFMPPGISMMQPAGGLISRFIASFTTGINFLILVPIIMTLLLFLIVTYASAMHVNIPITMGRHGAGGRYPVKLLYVSVMPVILATALFANIKIWAMVTKGIPIISTVFSALEWAVDTPFSLFERLLQHMIAEGFFQALVSMAPDILQAVVYIILMLVLCVIFGKFWVQLGGQSPENIANQLQSSGMYIPGFRKDKRIIEKILNRYIPPITILGSIFIGLLAGVGNMALAGVASGTGILLTVDIVYRLYEELAKQQIMESHPILGKLLGH